VLSESCARESDTVHACARHQTAARLLTLQKLLVILPVRAVTSMYTLLSRTILGMIRRRFNFYAFTLVHPFTPLLPPSPPLPPPLQKEALAHSSSSPRPKQSDKRVAIGGGRSRPGGGAGVLAACAPLAGAAENGMSPNPLFQMAPPMSPLRPVTCMGGNADMSSISRHAVGDGGGCGDMPRYDGPTTTPACTSGGGHAHASSRGRDAQNSDGWDHRGGELERHDPDQELEFEHHAHTAVGGGQRRGAVAVAVELATWQDPGRSAKLLGGGLYVMLCVSSLRSMPLPLSALACYGVIAALALSLVRKVCSKLRAGLGLGDGGVGQGGGGGVRGGSRGGGREGAEGSMCAASHDGAHDESRREREASARRVAAKLGGWVAASAAARAPVAAEVWLAGMRLASWDHPPTTLKALYALNSEP